MSKLTYKTYIKKTFKFEYAITYVPNTSNSKRFTKQDHQNKFEKSLLRILKTHDQSAKILISKVINDNSKDRKDKAHGGTVHYHLMVLTDRIIDNDSKFNFKHFTFHIQDLYYAKGWQEGYVDNKHHVLQVTHNIEKIQYIKINTKTLKTILEEEIIQILMLYSIKYAKNTVKKAQNSMFKIFEAQKYAVF